MTPFVLAHTVHNSEPSGDFFLGLFAPLRLSCPWGEWSILGNIWLSSFCLSQATSATAPWQHRLPLGNSCPPIQVDGWLWWVKSPSLSPGPWRRAATGLATGKPILRPWSAPVDPKRGLRWVPEQGNNAHGLLDSSLTKHSSGATPHAWKRNSSTPKESTGQSCFGGAGGFCVHADGC